MQGQGVSRQVNVVGPYVESLTVEVPADASSSFKVMDAVVEASRVDAEGDTPGLSVDQTNTYQPAVTGDAGAEGPDVNADVNLPLAP